MNQPRHWLKQNPEKVPFASRLLPAEAKAPLGAFYGFLQGCDEMARDHTQATEARKRNLQALETSLVGAAQEALPEFAADFLPLMRRHLPLLSGARDLLSGFVQDVQKTRYHDFTDLADYYQRADAPIGRAVLYICGQKHADMAASDALCHGLALLSHIRTASDDYVNLDRVYLPLDWFAFAGTTVSALAAPSSSAPLRKVFNRGLDHCESLLAKARPLPSEMSDRRLRAYIVWVQAMAASLCKRLRKHDPLGGDVSVGKRKGISALVNAALEI